MDYLAHPSPPSKHFDTFPLLFDLGKQRAILVEGGKAPVTWTASADVGKVVAHAIDSSEPWTLNGGMVGEKSDFATLVATAEKVTGEFPFCSFCFSSCHITSHPTHSFV